MRHGIRSIICCLMGVLMLLGTLAPQPAAQAGRKENTVFGRITERQRGTISSGESPEGSRDGSSELRKTAAKPARPTSWTDLRRRYPGTFTTRGPVTDRRIALTFDDVPDNHFTPKILNILARYHVKATFFIVGERARKYPAMVKRIVREGHAIGNHSFNHASFARLTQREFMRQITRTETVLKPLTGFSPRYIRPPYGEILPGQLEWAGRNGYYIVNWNVDSEDWRSIGSRKVLQNIKRTLTPGSIVLQHGGGGPGEDLSGTVQALPELIQYLRRKGYEIVTVPELLGKSAEMK